MIRSLQIRNFKSLRHVTLHLAEVTLLVGWNGAGKSNVLEALELLCWSARTPRLSDLSHAMDQHQVRIRGNLPDLLPLDGTASCVGFSLCVDGHPDEPPLQEGRVHGAPLGSLLLDLSLASDDPYSISGALPRSA